MEFSALLPFTAFILGFIVSIYLFAKWLRHRKRPKFLLFWSVALFLMYWFQVPLILSLLGRKMVITDFNLFFALTLPITFLALVFIYLGLLKNWGIKFGQTSKIIFLFWFLFALIFFVYYFISNEGIIRTYSMPLMGNIGFYVPIRILIICISAKELLSAKSRSAPLVLGTSLVTGESVIGIIRNFLVIRTVLSYPPVFWYIAMNSLKIFFVLQTTSVILLALGFLFLQRAWHRRAAEEISSSGL